VSDVSWFALMLFIYVSLSYEYINTTKKNTEHLLDFRKEVAVEISTEESK
jgi:hypothetical protein